MDVGEQTKHPALNEFDADDYDGEWLLIDRFLSMMAVKSLLLINKTK